MNLDYKESVEEVTNNVGNDVFVSVIVVTYNHEKYIRECLDGILAQVANFKFEILLGEDESNDRTREICISYANKHPSKIRLFLHSRANVISIGGKPTGRFNFLYNLSRARGNYIALCEGDDYWTDPYKLQKQVDFLEANPNYSICFHPTYVLNDKMSTLDDLKDLPETTDLYYLSSKGNYIHTVSVVFVNNLFNISQATLKLVPAGDYLIHLLNAREGLIKKLDEKMAVYRMHKGGVWSSLSKKNEYKNMIKQMDLMMPLFTDMPEIKKNLKNQRNKYIRKLRSEFLIYRFAYRIADSLNYRLGLQKK